RQGFSLILLPFKFGDAEIEDFNGLLILIYMEEDIIRFEIAMDNFAFMRDIDGGADLLHDSVRFRDREIAEIFNALAQRAALQIFHHQIDGILAGDAKVHYRNRIGMADLHGGLSLSAKPFNGSNIRNQLAMHNLDRDRDIELQ